MGLLETHDFGTSLNSLTSRSYFSYFPSSPFLTIFNIVTYGKNLLLLLLQTSSLNSRRSKRSIKIVPIKYTQLRDMCIIDV